ncbi:alpha/beta hydrolase [Emcibacteraceae bacterium]|nr:alpha/beta hydrolase [Emcibacteraceae bacterium]MDC1429347.1 alpha/beta hydrolase [Emcibacteraceae bacterium]
MNIKRAFVPLNNSNQVHYRTAGKGAPLVMLHPSPQNSETLIPAIAKFSEYCQCFALDTPGYGLSDDIDVENPEIGDYVEPIMEAITHLGINKFCLYGSATGGQIGIELAKRFPDRILLLMLDTNGHFTQDEIYDTMNGYFPAVTAKRDGGHLLTYWDMCRHLYVSFPWNSSNGQDKININLPSAETINTIFLRYLSAGETYGKAYMAALKTEHIGHIIDVKVPTTILRWQGSILLGATDALIDKGLADNFMVLNAGPSLDERYQVQLYALKDLYLDNPDRFEKMSIQSEEKKVRRNFYNGTDLSIYYLHNDIAENKPIIIISELGSSQTTIPKIEFNDRPAYFIDLPGHGGSSSVEGEVSLDNLTQPIAAMINELDFDVFDIVAFGSGAAIALELSSFMSVENLCIVDLNTQNETINFDYDRILPKIDGSHIPTIWAMARDSELYYPWNIHNRENILHSNPNLNPSYLHEKAVNIFRTAYIQKDLELIKARYKWDEKIQNSKSTIRMAYRANYPDKLKAVNSLKTQPVTIELPEDISLWQDLLFN